MNVSIRLRHLKLPSLVYRRLRGDLIETYKMMNGHYNIDVNTLLPEGKNPTTRGHNFKLSKQRFNTDTRKRFFSLRVVNYWNALPDNRVEASTTNTFKNRLDKFYILYYTIYYILIQLLLTSFSKCLISCYLFVQVPDEIQLWLSEASGRSWGGYQTYGGL